MFGLVMACTTIMKNNNVQEKLLLFHKRPKRGYNNVHRVHRGSFAAAGLHLYLYPSRIITCVKISIPFVAYWQWTIVPVQLMNSSRCSSIVSIWPFTFVFPLQFYQARAKLYCFRKAKVFHQYLCVYILQFLFATGLHVAGRVKAETNYLYKYEKTGTLINKEKDIMYIVQKERTSVAPLFLALSLIYKMRMMPTV